MYDTIASRYKYTIKEFYDLTLRQIQYLCKLANVNIYREATFTASLHRIKLKPVIEPLKVSKKEREAFDKQALSALARLQKRYEEKKKKAALKKSGDK